MAKLKETIDMPLNKDTRPWVRLQLLRATRRMFCHQATRLEDPIIQICSSKDTRTIRVIRPVESFLDTCLFSFRLVPRCYRLRLHRWPTLDRTACIRLILWMDRV